VVDPAVFAVIAEELDAVLTGPASPPGDGLTGATAA
jgi:hypothetical protein